MTTRSAEWIIGYKAGKDGVMYVEGKSADFISGWLIGQRDRFDDDLIDQYQSTLEPR